MGNAVPHLGNDDRQTTSAWREDHRACGSQANLAAVRAVHRIQSTIVAALGVCMIGIFAALAEKSAPLLISQNFLAIAPLLMGIVASATCAGYCLFRLLNHHW